MRNSKIHLTALYILTIPQYFVLLFISVFIWSGCARIPTPTRSVQTGQSGTIGSCADFFASLDKRVKEAGVIDPGSFRVENYPYLRTDRLIASFSGDVIDDKAFFGLVSRMQALDREARKYEIMNLPDSDVAELDPIKGKKGLFGKVAECSDVLKAEDFNNEENRKRLLTNVTVPDDYIPFRRFLGLYPLTSLIISWRVDIWHAEALKTFSTEPPSGWQAIRYFPPDLNNLLSPAQIVQQAARDPLGIPVYSSGELEILFRAWAPVWEVQTMGDYDHIGAPFWNEGTLAIDTGQQPTYTQLSFTRFGGEILTQLNYIIWFPSRPKEGPLDIYGGFLDGLIYRVTLDKNGEAILYETVHNCGCYYKAYPTARLKVREKIKYAEPPLILKAPEIVPANDVMTVAMESRTHYVQHLYSGPRSNETEMPIYFFVNYNKLRSLPYFEEGRRSMFGQDSIVPGSQRLERFILWPTGILSPGAMRQWGRHAVAFVGNRYFDDPFFMDEAFQQNNIK